MRITKKILSLLLAVIMLCGTLAGFSVITASAADTNESENTQTPADEKLPDNGEDALAYRMKEPFANPEEMLALMEKKYTKGNYSIYAYELTGEVAIKDNVTGQIMFTNPYDVASSGATENIKNQLLSQIVVTYIDNGKTNVYYSSEWAAKLNQISVKQIRGGIRVEYTIGREQAKRLLPRWITKDRFDSEIKPGIMAYYNVTEDDIQENGLASGGEGAWYYNRFLNFYGYTTPKDLDACATDLEKADMIATYPCTGHKEGNTYVSDMVILVFDPTATDVQLAQNELYLKSACPDYTYEMLDYDHQLTGYVSKDENPPLFKMALEYTINEDGFSVRLPANGIRFNQEKYQLENISVLPYMGAGNNNYTGYTFYPDGSGALFAFEDLADEDTYSVTGRMYGEDYAYHTLKGESQTGTAYQQEVRYPVFGLVENTRYYDCLDESGSIVNRVSGVIYDALSGEADGISDDMAAKISEKYDLGDSQVETVESRGFLAILEEGDALASLTYSHAGVVSPYDTVRMDFNPRPKDSYNLSDSISVGTNSAWTVVSTRKYVGSYRIRYIMLTDEAVGENTAITQPEDWNWYPATWLGMAKAYRTYLIDKGVLTALYEGVADSELQDIPLYIESFGATETTEKILSVPVTLQKALTTFEDVKTMYVGLLAKQVTNVNFKLTGFYNGGLYSTMPYNLDWEKVVSDEVEFQELLNFAAKIKNGEYDEIKAYAKEILSESDANALIAYLDDASNQPAIAASLGIFPDFEFSYTDGDKMFDGLSLSKHAVKTIDNRYTSKRMYSATQQKYVGYYQLAISPAYFSYFYDKLMQDYGAYDNVTGISIGSLGTDLNSDFDEDEPYNREDSKTFITKTLEYFQSKDMDVMVDGGNAYTWKYVDHILNAPLDSSRYILASYSVPFLGVVLHGYVEFAGSPLNMEGNVAYATLKAIENGASIYFNLSYRNTQILKEDPMYSQYYSVRYDIWSEDVIEIYNKLNADMKDVQNDTIINHEFLTGLRVPDADEMQSDMTSKYDEILNYRDELSRYEEQMKVEGVANAREDIASVAQVAAEFIELCLDKYTGASGGDSLVKLYSTANDRFQLSLANYMEAKANCEDLSARYATLSAVENPTDAQQAELDRLATALATAEKDRNLKQSKLSNSLTKLNNIVKQLQDAYLLLAELYNDALEGKLLIDAARDTIPASVLAEVEANLKKANALMSETLGVKFDESLEKMGMDTFVSAHIAELIVDCNGEAGADDPYAVGRAENLYNLYFSKNYGLKADELHLLKMLGANRSLSDEELLAKYGLNTLADGQGSTDALVTFMLEMLGENIGFDPTMSDEEINDQLIAYVECLLFARIESLVKSDKELTTFVPGLHVITTKVDNKTGEIVEDSAAIAKMNMAKLNIENAAKAALAAAVKAGGDLSFSNNYTEKQMQELIDKVMNGSNGLKSVAYDAGADKEADIRACMKGYYYAAILGDVEKYLGVTDEVTLNVMSTSYSSADTMAVIYNAIVAGRDVAYGNMVKVYADIMNDPAVATELEALAKQLSAYGDMLKADDLRDAFKQQAANAMLSIVEASVGHANLEFQAPITKYNAANKALKDLPEDDFKAAVTATMDQLKTYLATSNTSFDVNYKAALRALNDLFATDAYANDDAKYDGVKSALAGCAEEVKKCISATAEVEAYLYGELKGDDDVTVDELDAMAAKIMTIAGNVNVGPKEYVYSFYFNYLSNSYVPVYFYNEDLVAMDIALRELTEAKGEALRAELPADATARQVYELIFKTLSDDSASIDAAITKISKELGWRMAKNYDTAYDMVMAQYIYLLTCELSDAMIGYQAATLPGDYTTAVAEALDEAIVLQTATLLDDADGDYTLRADVNAIVTELVDSLVAAGLVDASAKDALLPVVAEVFTDAYYAAVMDHFGAADGVDFNACLYQVYTHIDGDECGFYLTSQKLMDMATRYVSLLTGLDPKDLIVVDEEEDEGEENKYLSDDGRIVAVTYGSDKGATKTFILNYNKFSVRVNYPQADGDATEESVLYTIPAYSYVVVEYDHGN